MRTKTSFRPDLAVEKMTQAIEAMRSQRERPEAIVSGPGEWAKIKRWAPDFCQEHYDGETFLGVPVVTVAKYGEPQLMADRHALAEALGVYS